MVDRSSNRGRKTQSLYTRHNKQKEQHREIIAVSKAFRVQKFSNFVPVLISIVKVWLSLPVAKSKRGYGPSEKCTWEKQTIKFLPPPFLPWVGTWLSEWVRTCEKFLNIIKITFSCNFLSSLAKSVWMYMNFTHCFIICPSFVFVSNTSLLTLGECRHQCCFSTSRC